jgi:hypothetical protein
VIADQIHEGLVALTRPEGRRLRLASAHRRDQRELVPGAERVAGARVLAIHRHHDRHRGDELAETMLPTHRLERIGDRGALRQLDLE